MPECEERWTVTFHRGDTSWYEERGALAAGQKAAEVETSTEPLLFGAGCAHKYEMLFRHTAVLFTVILHHQREEAFVSAWHQHICLETLTLLNRHRRFRLQRDSLHQIPSACLGHGCQMSLPCYFRQQCPSYPSASSWALGT